MQPIISPTIKVETHCIDVPKIVFNKVFNSIVFIDILVNKEPGELLHQNMKDEMINISPLIFFYRF